jgi:DNA replication licensing factor MCM4
LCDLICDFVFVADIEKMVSIKGMIIRCSSVIPELKEAVFRCLVCGFYSEPVMVDRGMVLIDILIMQL